MSVNRADRSLPGITALAITLARRLYDCQGRRYGHHPHTRTLPAGGRSWVVGNPLIAFGPSLHSLPSPERRSLIHEISFRQCSSGYSADFASRNYCRERSTEIRGGKEKLAPGSRSLQHSCRAMDDQESKQLGLADGTWQELCMPSGASQKW